MIASLFFIAKLIEVEDVLVSYEFDLILATEDSLMMKRVQFINRPRFPVVSLIYFNDLVNKALLKKLVLKNYHIHIHQ